MPYPVITDVAPELMNHTLKLVLNAFGAKYCVKLQIIYAFCVFTASSRRQNRQICTLARSKLFTGNIPVLLMPNDKPQGHRLRCAAGGAGYAAYPCSM
jgi:hypothetical protein